MLPFPIGLGVDELDPLMDTPLSRSHPSHTAANHHPAPRGYSLTLESRTSRQVVSELSRVGDSPDAGCLHSTLLISRGHTHGSNGEPLRHKCGALPFDLHKRWQRLVREPAHPGNLLTGGMQMTARRRRSSFIATRRAAGFTQEGLAYALHVDRSTVIRWESGRHLPVPYLWPKLGRLLGVSKERLQRLFADDQPLTLPPGSQVVVLADSAVASLPWRTSLGRSGTGYVAGVVSAQQPVGEGLPMHAALLGQYEALTDHYRQIDYQAGAQAVYGDVVGHLNRLSAAADQVPSALYRRYVGVLGDTAQLAAWLAIDSQDYATARQFCAVALSSAQEGEDPTLHAYVLGVMSYIHLHAKRGNEALRLLEAALRIANTTRFGVNPAVRSWLYEAAGEAYAFADDRQAGATALAKAEQLFDGVQLNNVPQWLGFFNAQEHAARLKGRCLMRLGDGRTAITTLQTACELLPEHYVRERSGTLIDLASAHLMEANSSTDAPEPEAAASSAMEAWQLAVITQSGRNQRRIKELLPSFQPYAHLDRVQALAAAVG